MLRCILFKKKKKEYTCKTYNNEKNIDGLKLMKVNFTRKNNSRISNFFVENYLMPFILFRFFFYYIICNKIELAMQKYDYSNIVKTLRNIGKGIILVLN